MRRELILRYPVTTEKAVRLMESENKLVFVVDRRAKKPQIKKIIEETYKVKVKKVNTLVTPSGKKKAYITLELETPAIDVATKLGLM